MVNSPDVILFDLDDTLISFEGTAEPAWEKCCRDFVGRHSVPYDAARLLETVHTTRRQFWSDPEKNKRGRFDMIAARRSIVASALEQLDSRNDALSNVLADSYSEYRDRLICLFPNTIVTLGALKTRGIRLGVVTNGTSASQRGKLDRFDLGKYFEHILIEGELGYGKPDERVYTMALSLFGVSPEYCWMVGDNLIWDVQAPQSLGLCGIWHDYLKAGLPQDTAVCPDHIITDISEVLTLL